jgi:hypothetical protein
VVSYTPTFTGDGGNPTAKAISGYYVLNGKICTVWINVKVAANGGGVGIIRLGLPFPSAANPEEQRILARLDQLNNAAVPPDGGNFAGIAVIFPSSSQAVPMFPKSSTKTTLDWLQSGSPGTGVPAWPSNYSINENTRINLQGTYITA